MRITGVFFLAFVCCVPASGGSLAVAQSGALPDSAAALALRKAQSEHRLETLQQEMRASAQDIARFQADVAVLKQDQALLDRRLIEAAARIQSLEEKLSTGERRLSDLDGQQAGLRASLAAQHDTIGRLLSVLQRMGRNPPPALLVEPENALKAVRSAILLGGFMPVIRQDIDKLTRDLEALVQLRRLVDSETAQNKTEINRLAEERVRLDVLMAQKKTMQMVQEADLAKVRQQDQKLLTDAKTMQELIARLTTDLSQAQQRQMREEQEAKAAQNVTPPTNGLDSASSSAQHKQASLVPKLSFDQVRGRVSIPVAGEVVRRFGAPDSGGGVTKGVSFATRAGAQVIAPADGTVVFAGAFRAYGQIVIIDAGHGYHILLAGVERITVSAGQFVLAGEPVAQMGARTLASAALLDIKVEQPVLYVEFRKDSTVIDPTPWWSGKTDEKARG